MKWSLYQWKMWSGDKKCWHCLSSTIYGHFEFNVTDTHHTKLCNIPNEKSCHALRQCYSITLSKNVIQGTELKENKIHVGHLGKYPPFSRYALTTYSCVTYETKGISMPYNIAVALPYQKMWSRGVNWRKTKHTSAILENIRHFQDIYLSHIVV